MHVQGILSDLFPGITLPEHDYGKLQSGIIEAMEKRGLQVQGYFTLVFTPHIHTHARMHACMHMCKYLQWLPWDSLHSVLPPLIRHIMST